MHLRAELLEDEHGRQTPAVTLELHAEHPAARPWPAPDERFSKLSFPNQLSIFGAGSAGASIVVASLDILAPDEALTEVITSVLDALAGDDSVVTGDISGRFSASGRSPSSEERAILIGAARARLRRRHSTSPIRLHRLDVVGFRRLDTFHLDVQADDLTVLIGPNGAAKTTLLDAIALLAGRLASHVQRDAEGEPAKGAISPRDIRIGDLAASIRCTAELGGSVVSWALSKTLQGPTEADEDDLSDFVSTLREGWAAGDRVTPLVVYYRIGRGALDVPDRIRTKHVFDLQSAWSEALEEGSSFRHFVEWFRDREDLENEVRLSSHPWHRDAHLRAVRRAIETLMGEGFTDVRYRRMPAPGRLTVKKNDLELSIDQLSAGERVVVALAGDLARRLALANPDLDDPLRAPAVVLIDEIELHMHPGWQRRILPDLRRTFPHCQLVVTTHSPQVLGLVEASAVRLLEPTARGVTERRAGASLGLDVARLLEDLFEVPSRPEVYQGKLDDLFRAIDEARFEDARAALAHLRTVFGNSEPELTRAEVRLRRREPKP